MEEKEIGRVSRRLEKRTRVRGRFLLRTARTREVFLRRISFRVFAQQRVADGGPRELSRQRVRLRTVITTVPRRGAVKRDGDDRREINDKCRAE